MMSIRRLVTVCSALLIAASLAGAQPAKKDDKKRSKQEQVEIEQLVKIVDGVMGGQATPTDVKMSIEPYFMKSQEVRTFVPFVLSVMEAPQTDASMYVRVVNPTAEPAAKGKKVEYPWDDIHFVPAAQLAGSAVKLQRVFMATAGTYDVYVAFKERLPEKAPKNQVPKMGVLKTQVVVPDFYNAELNTSSILVTDRVNTLTAMIGPEEARERPFVFGQQELVPAMDMDFKKSEELSIFFQVYNSGLDPSGKPNLTLEYEFHRKEAEGEKFFNKTSPQTVNASNLPPTFDPAKFPVPGGITVPLTSFAEGTYRLQIKVTDKAAGKTLTRDVNFSVKAS
ncbi:MAG: hypothetical protein ACRD2N_09245 [Vicinamibacterales bacterium]